MMVGCPFITCAVKQKGIEFCWQCDESETCARWRAHRKFSRSHDTFVCYRKLEDNIASIRQNGVPEFEQGQKLRERLLREMLDGFNEGRSKTYYSIAAAIMELDDLKNALSQAERASAGMERKEKSKLLHARLDEIAARKSIVLKLRKSK